MVALGGISMAAYMLIHPWDQRAGNVATTVQWFVSHGFHFVGAVLMVLGLFGLYLRQREATGKAGLLSFVVAYLGTVLFVGTGVTSTFLWPAIADVAPSFVAADGGMLNDPLVLIPIYGARVFLVLGYVWFGFVSFRAGVLPRGGSLLVMVGVVGMNVPPQLPWAVSVVGALVFCAGLLSWAWALWHEVPDAAEAPFEFLKTKKLLLGSVTALLVVGLVVGIGASMQFGNTIRSCFEQLDKQQLSLSSDRSGRFLGKVTAEAAWCRGGQKAADNRDTPYVDWPNYYAAADANSQSGTWLDLLLWRHLERNGRGLDGALMDLERQRVELIQFNLFDNSGTYAAYVQGRGGVRGPALRFWPEMQLPEGHRHFAELGGVSGQPNEQVCSGDLIRSRTLLGVCNDVFNPAMGSTGMLFARNVQFEVTFPVRNRNASTIARHGDRLGLLTPDPQLISRKLFTRPQDPATVAGCNLGQPGDPANAECDYTKAPFFNVLAAFWIQFMTHDWFSHLDEGANQADAWMEVGCVDDEAKQLGCRPGDRMDSALIAQDGPAPRFTSDGKEQDQRAYQTARNNVTAWWDASQIYGYDETSVKRVKRDPADPAKLLLEQLPGRSGEGDGQGYLPLLAADDPQQPHWQGQEAVAFPDNFNIGLSFFHNVFAREHNYFVNVFRCRQGKLTVAGPDFPCDAFPPMPDEDSGLRNPSAPDDEISYSEVSDEELYQAARLVVAAEIAKIHTIEWTTQLLYDDPLYEAMNSNWSGVFDEGSRLAGISERIRAGLVASTDPDKSNLLASVFASGSGIVGSGNGMKDRKSTWDMANLLDVGGGVNHFGSPFNFPEEFVSVYRLHPLLPDLIDFRELDGDPNAIQTKVPVVETAFGRATTAMHDGGLANWALSMGRQRLGALVLGNHPLFLQNLEIGRLQSDTGMIDVVALDILRDRERGVPRFNEFRRQYGLTSFKSFEELAGPVWGPRLREVYGTHVCDASKIITGAQREGDGTEAREAGDPLPPFINDCFGGTTGDVVDNIEDVDNVVGWLAEQTRPHGYAITETQFQVFIVNASRRLFSDRFFTSSLRPEFYTWLGYDWVMNNGPGDKQFEPGAPNGHADQEVSGMKRLLLRVMPELADELAVVISVFDPWARDRGEFYCLDWVPRPGAESDPAFANWQNPPDGLKCTEEANRE